jgi:hypothetical protein
VTSLASRILAYAWASPNTLIGALSALAVLGRAQDRQIERLG